MDSIGIDLGTTNSVASIMSGAAPAVIGKNESSYTPSVVAWRREAKGGRFLVGHPALNYANQEPSHTITSIKRLMGLNYNDPEVQRLGSRALYKIGPPSEGGDIGVRVELDGQKYSPVDISAQILRAIKARCETELERPIQGATITVPAYFLDTQKNATKEAGVLAGFKLHPLLDEPIAAALAFGLGPRADERHRLLVYDLGGGTFDVSLIQMAKDNIQVLNKRGDMWLGGDDFDDFIVRRLEHWLQQRFGLPQIADPGVRWRLKLAAQKAKHQLSQHEEFTILESFLPSASEIGAVSLDVTIRRSEFEADIAPLVQTSMDLLEEVLDEAAVQPHELTAVLLVGGSTQVPLVRNRLYARFGRERVRHDVDPMQSVSLGAALWCQRFPFDEKGELRLGSFERTGIPIALDLGVEVYHEGNPHHFVPIIRAGTTYPTRPGHFYREFYPTAENQMMVRVPIFQGRNVLTTYNRPQGVITVELPHGVPQRTPVVITFNIDKNGNLAGELQFEGFPDLRREWAIQRNQGVVPEDELERLENWKSKSEETLRVARDFERRYKVYLAPPGEDVQQAVRLFQTLQKQLEDAIAAGDRELALARRDTVLNFFIGSSTASVLYLARRAQNLAGVVADAKDLCELQVCLEQAHAKGDAALVQKLTEKLKPKIFRILHSQTGAASTGPLRGQLTPA